MTKYKPADSKLTCCKDGLTILYGKHKTGKTRLAKWLARQYASYFYLDHIPTDTEWQLLTTGSLVPGILVIDVDYLDNEFVHRLSTYRSTVLVVTLSVNHILWYAADLAWRVTQEMRRESGLPLGRCQVLEPMKFRTKQPPRGTAL